MKHFFSLGPTVKVTLIFPFLLGFIALKTFSQTYQREDIKIMNNGESGALFNRMATDDHGFLWYNTYNGFVMNYGNSDLELSTAPYDLNRTNIVTKSGENIFCLTDMGIFKIDPQSKGIVTIINDFSDKEKPKLISLVEDREGTLWIGTSSNYIIKLDRDKNHKKIVLLDTILVPKGDNPRLSRFSLYTERDLGDDQLLLRRGRKLYLLRKDSIVPFLDWTGSQKFKYAGLNRPLWNNNGGDGLLITDNGVLFGKDRSGTYRFNGIPFTYLYSKKINAHIVDSPFEESLVISRKLHRITSQIADLITVSDDGKALLFHKFIKQGNGIELKKVEEIRFKNYIEDVHIDSNEVIYVSHFDTISKIKFIDPGFKTYLNDYRTPTNSFNISTRDILGLENGNLLVASYSGIFEIDVNEENNPMNLYPDISYIRSFVKMNDSLTIAFGENPKIHFLDPANKREFTVLSQVQTHFQDAIKINDSLIYMGAEHGLFSFNVHTRQVAALPKILDTIPLGPVFIKDLNLADNILYIATDGQGLFAHNLSTGEKERYHKDHKDSNFRIPGNTVYCTFRDSGDRIWIGTDNGIVKLNRLDGLPEHFDQTENQKVVGILEENGNIWFSTYNGLYKIAPNKSVIFSYFMEDGLPDNEFNQNSCHKTRDGRLIFGGVNGLVSFTQIDTDWENYKPRLYPISYETFDMVYNQLKTRYILQNNDTIDLSHENNYLKLNFSINDHLFANNHTYHYRLGDLSPEWIDLDSQNHLDLNFVPPGNHTLKIKGINSKGVEASNVLTYELHISEVFYKTPLFKYMTTVFAFVLMALLGVWHFKRKQNLLKHRLSSLQLERKVLRSQMQPHFVFNALNSLIHKDYDKHTLKEHILQVSGLMRKTLESSRHDFVSLKDELDYIESYVAHENSLREIPIAYRAVCDCDENTIDLPSMMVQPIVENCIKHAFNNGTDNPGITLEIRKDEQSLRITISDNGTGFRKASNKNGSQALTIARERINIWNKLGRTKRFKMAIEDRKRKNPSNSGTRVLLVLPYKTSLVNLSSD